VSICGCRAAHVSVDGAVRGAVASLRVYFPYIVLVYPCLPFVRVETIAFSSFLGRRGDGFLRVYFGTRPLSEHFRHEHF
jgi:hypothetical protein